MNGSVAATFSRSELAFMLTHCAWYGARFASQRAHTRPGSFLPQCGGTIALVGAHAWQNTPPQPRQWWRRQNTSNLAPPGARQPGSMQRGACRSGTHAGGWPIGSAGGGSGATTAGGGGARGVAGACCGGAPYGCGGAP